MVATSSICCATTSRRRQRCWHRKGYSYEGRLRNGTGGGGGRFLFPAAASSESTSPTIRLLIPGSCLVEPCADIGSPGSQKLMNLTGSPWRRLVERSSACEWSISGRGRRRSPGLASCGPDCQGDRRASPQLAPFPSCPNHRDS